MQNVLFESRKYRERENLVQTVGLGMDECDRDENRYAIKTEKRLWTEQNNLQSNMSFRGSRIYFPITVARQWFSRRAQTRRHLHSRVRRRRVYREHWRFHEKRRRAIVWRERNRRTWYLYTRNVQHAYTLYCLARIDIFYYVRKCEINSSGLLIFGYKFRMLL